MFFGLSAAAFWFRSAGSNTPEITTYWDKTPKTDPFYQSLRFAARMGRDDITVHGFRSTFRDLTSETTDYPNEAVEMALAHAINDQAEAAYRRGDMLERGRPLMNQWAAFSRGITAATANDRQTPPNTADET